MNQNTIYVGNLPYQVTDEDLQTRFSQYGDIEKATVIREYDTGRSKGFAFVTFSDANSEGKEAANLAVLKENDTDLGGRKIRVKIAEDNPNRRGGGGGGGAGARRRERGDRGDRRQGGR